MSSDFQFGLRFNPKIAQDFFRCSECEASDPNLAKFIHSTACSENGRPLKEWTKITYVYGPNKDLFDTNMQTLCKLLIPQSKPQAEPETKAAASSTTTTTVMVPMSKPQQQQDTKEASSKTTVKQEPERKASQTETKELSSRTKPSDREQEVKADAASSMTTQLVTSSRTSAALDRLLINMSSHAARVLEQMKKEMFREEGKAHQEISSLFVSPVALCETLLEASLTASRKTRAMIIKALGLPEEEKELRELVDAFAARFQGDYVLKIAKKIDLLDVRLGRVNAAIDKRLTAKLNDRTFVPSFTTRFEGFLKAGYVEFYEDLFTCRDSTIKKVQMMRELKPKYLVYMDKPHCRMNVINIPLPSSDGKQYTMHLADPTNVQNAAILGVVESLNTLIDHNLLQDIINKAEKIDLDSLCYPVIRMRNRRFDLTEALQRLFIIPRDENFDFLEETVDKEELSIKVAQQCQSVMSTAIEDDSEVYGKLGGQSFVIKTPFMVIITEKDDKGNVVEIMRMSLRNTDGLVFRSMG